MSKKRLLTVAVVDCCCCCYWLLLLLTVVVECSCCCCCWLLLLLTVVVVVVVDCCCCCCCWQGWAGARAVEAEPEPRRVRAVHGALPPAPAALEHVAGAEQPVVGRTGPAEPRQPPDHQGHPHAPVGETNGNKKLGEKTRKKNTKNGGGNRK